MAERRWLIEIPAAVGPNRSLLPTWVWRAGQTLEVLEPRAILATLEACGGHRQNLRVVRIGVRTLGAEGKWKDEGSLPRSMSERHLQDKHIRP